MHGPDRRLGDAYFQLTKQGLTKELGFVGYYGEVLDWMTELYESTRIPGQEGDPLLKAQLVTAAKARAFFRYPAVDANGFRAMRAETVVGWRDDHFPGDVTYGQRDTWDASALGSAAVTLDPELIGYAQEMLEDNQYFQMVSERAHPKDWRGINGLLDIIDAADLIKKQPVGKSRLPMTPGQPDFAWVDSENGVVAVKFGDERLYASLYWRSRNAVNALARVHYLAPRYSVITTMPEEVEFPQSGQTWKRPNWTAFGFANGGHKYPDKIPSALAGEILPIAKVPDGIAYKVGEENIFAGKASFYALRYGNWIMAVNTTKSETFTLKPVGGKEVMVKNLVTGALFSSKEEQRVGPLGSVVVKLVP